MTGKFRQARKEAFLAALRATGNKTLAAEKAKVSRSLVQLWRAGDSRFARAEAKAVAGARARFAPNPERRPPSGWGFLDGAELMVRGTSARGGGKRVQIARARTSDWSPRVERTFLTALSATCNVSAACAEAGMSKTSAYARRRRWPAFQRQWDEAIETGYMQIEVGLIEAAGNLFSDDGPVETGPIRDMTADHAIHLLHMHKRTVHRIGKRPGFRARDPDIEEVRAEILRKVEAMKGADKKRLERDRKAWARRRG